MIPTTVIFPELSANVRSLFDRIGELRRSLEVGNLDSITREFNLHAVMIADEVLPKFPSPIGQGSSTEGSLEDLWEVMDRVSKKLGNVFRPHIFHLAWDRCITNWLVAVNPELF